MAVHKSNSLDFADLSVGVRFTEEKKKKKTVQGRNWITLVMRIILDSVNGFAHKSRLLMNQLDYTGCTYIF